jgi:transposase InsO family protein
LLLAREGYAMNRKKLYRIYREEELMVRRRGRRKRAIGTRPLALPNAINRRWSLDFVSDALGDGRRFRIFCVVDDFSRECLAPDAMVVSLVGDTVSALINLGYKPAEAKRAVDSVDGFDEKDGLETLIRKSLAIIVGER